MKIGDNNTWLEATSKARPYHPALIDERGEMSFKELYIKSVLAAKSLSGWGVKKRTRVALFLTNSREYIVYIHALSEIGAELVLINTRLTSPEISRQLDRLDVSLVVVEPQFREKLDSYDGVIISTDKEDDSYLHTRKGKYSSYTIRSGDIFCYVFTSGTTGRPKIVPLTYENLSSSAIASAFRLGYQNEDKWLLTMPLFHLGGLAIVFRGVIYGMSIIIQKKFSEKVLIDKMQRTNPTIISLVPTMLQRLLHQGDHPFPPSIRVILLGGAAPRKTLLREIVERKLPVALTYGMTESSSQIATATPKLTLAKPGCVGKPLRWITVKILKNGQEVEAHKIGSLWVNGPQITKGYYHDEHANRTKIKEGYLDTGDFAYRDEDGDIFVVQRRSDLIISGGENVYPTEVENALIDTLDIEEAIVLGLDDQEWGQQVVAVVSGEEKNMTAKELQKLLRRELAGYKVPNKWYNIDQFPTTGSGKIRRAEVLKLLKEGSLEEIG